MNDAAAAPSADRLRLDAAGIDAFLRAAFPLAPPEYLVKVIELRPGFVRVRRASTQWDLRPGNLVSGPTQMAMVDSVGYVLVAAHFGPMEMAVTSALNMQFLRPCPPGDIHADATLLKLGRRMVNMDVRLWTQAPEKPVAHATVTYALP
jgi:uncharacterized protein (TIGR00369 family)